MQRTVQAPYFRTFAPLPGYLSHQAPEDACFVEEGCLGGTGSRKVHFVVHPSTCTYAEFVHGTRIVNA